VLKAFTSVSAVSPIERSNDHGGTGVISFRRLLDQSDFRSPVDFVDYTIIPAGSTIGKHQHNHSDEIYFIAAGSPIVRVNGREARLEPGSLAIVHDGEWHELVNDTAQGVEILVIQLRN
jgi:mannose-6-phosphate isomerase-like protein (cupin superfamily)